MNNAEYFQLSAVRDELRAVTAQRDELRAACQKVLADINHGYSQEDTRQTLIAALEHVFAGEYYNKPTQSDTVNAIVDATNLL